MNATRPFFPGGIGGKKTSAVGWFTNIQMITHTTRLSFNKLQYYRFRKNGNPEQDPTARRFYMSQKFMISNYLNQKANVEGKDWWWFLSVEWHWSPQSYWRITTTNLWHEHQHSQISEITVKIMNCNCSFHVHCPFRLLFLCATSSDLSTKTNTPNFQTYDTL